MIEFENVNKNIKEKKDLFFYFVYKLKEKYDSLNTNPDELNRYHILKMLFIACVKNNKMLEIGFNNFYAMPKGPVEIDCYYFFIFPKGKNFEETLKNKLNIKENIEEDIEENKKIIIQESINKIPNFLYKLDHEKLINYTHTFKSWKIAWFRANIYNKEKFYITPNDIKNDY